MYQTCWKKSLIHTHITNHTHSENTQSNKKQRRYNLKWFNKLPSSAVETLFFLLINLVEITHSTLPNFSPTQIPITLNCLSLSYTLFSLHSFLRGNTHPKLSPHLFLFSSQTAAPHITHSASQMCTQPQLHLFFFFNHIGCSLCRNCTHQCTLHFDALTHCRPSQASKNSHHLGYIYDQSYGLGLRIKAIYIYSQDSILHIYSGFTTYIKYIHYIIDETIIPLFIL